MEGLTDIMSAGPGGREVGSQTGYGHGFSFYTVRGLGQVVICVWLW